MYVAYYCSKCRTEFVLLVEQVKEMEDKGRYVACPFGHKNSLLKLNKHDGLRDCFNQKYSALT